MALDTAATIAKLNSLTAKFDTRMEAAVPFYPQICTIKPSKRKTEAYGWLGSVPKVREWIGDRQFSKLRAAQFSIDNRKWESSLRIEKDDIEDDVLDMYGPTLEQLGDEAAHHPDELVSELIVAGETAPCFDGQLFYDTDHSWGDSGTQSNDLTAACVSSVAITAAEFLTAYHAARAKFFTYRNDQGQLLNRPRIGQASKLMLMVPPTLELVATQALTATVVATGASNIVLDRPQIVVYPYFTSGVKFYLHDLSRPLKPFVFQERKALDRKMKGLDDMEFQDVKFMTEARYSAGYLAWWTSILTTFVQS